MYARGEQTNLQTPSNLLPVVRGHLRSDEEVLWTDKPIAWRLGVRRWPRFVFGVIMLAVVSLFLRRVSDVGDSKSHVTPVIVWPMVTMLLLAGALFVGFAVALIASPLLRMMEASGTRYVITSQRVLIFEISRFRSNTVHEFAAGDVRRVVVMRGTSGVGDVLLWRGPIDFSTLVADRHNMVTGDWRSDTGLLAISNLDQVEQLIRTHHLHLDPVA